jgi:hypothetical protein
LACDKYRWASQKVVENLTDPHLVAGFSDPAELEPERRPGRSPDLRRLAGLLAQSLAALGCRGCDNPVWHCTVRAAPEDRTLSDAEWAQVAAGIMDRTGLVGRPTERAVIGIMWVIEDHLRPSGHIMPDHAGDRGAELLVLAPHDLLHINQIRSTSGRQMFLHRSGRTAQ